MKKIHVYIREQNIEFNLNKKLLDSVILNMYLLKLISFGCVNLYIYR